MQKLNHCIVMTALCTKLQLSELLNFFVLMMV